MEIRTGISLGIIVISAFVGMGLLLLIASLALAQELTFAELVQLIDTILTNSD